MPLNNEEMRNVNGFNQINENNYMNNNQEAFDYKMNNNYINNDEIQENNEEISSYVDLKEAGQKRALREFKLLLNKIDEKIDIQSN